GRGAAGAEGDGQLRIAVLVHEARFADGAQLLGEQVERLVPADPDPAGVFLFPLPRVGPLHRTLHAVGVVELLDQAVSADAGTAADGIRRVATARARRGFKKGDVFAIYSPNLPEYAIVFLAVASLGGTVTTVNPLYTAGELANQLKDCGARVLITVPMFLDKA